MRVVLAIDGSNYSEAAIKMLTSHMRAEETEILVLEVVEPFVYSTPPQMSRGYAPEMAERQREQFAQAEASVERVAQSLRAGGFRVDTRAVEAEVRTGILDVAAEWKADLIVVGSHGRKGFSRFLLGSVAESIARHAPCSVLIMRTPPQL